VKEEQRKKQKKSHRSNQITLPKLRFSALNEVFPSYAQELGVQEESVPLENSETSPATSFMCPPTVGIVKICFRNIWVAFPCATTPPLAHLSDMVSLLLSLEHQETGPLPQNLTTDNPGKQRPKQSHKENGSRKKPKKKKRTARLLHQMLSQEKNNHLKARTQQQQHQETSREETRRKNQQMLSQANKIKISL
jgi:hypothetical protein